MKPDNICIFCAGTEPNTKSLKVCSSCVAKFVSLGHDGIEKWAEGRDLTTEQAKFLGLRGRQTNEVVS